MTVNQSKNQVYLHIKREFSPEHFHKLDVVEALVEVGFSRMETKRLLKQNAVKVWDTRLMGNKIHWYKRAAEAIELIEWDEEYQPVLLIGSHRALIIEPKQPFFWRQLWWTVRPFWERLILDKIT